MRVLVTGGAAFIGSAVRCHFICDLEHEVIAVDRLSCAGKLASLSPVATNSGFAFDKQDICDVAGWRTPRPRKGMRPSCGFM
jgi:dTDP-glucose 4,6-dehydratase